MSASILQERAVEYAKLCGIVLDLKSPLGHGTDGSVWASSRKTAVKALERGHNYEIELECYRRFRTARVSKIHGFSVPHLIGNHDALWIIEMRIVTPPFILDFAKAWLDEPPEFEEGGWEQWYDEGREKFEANWDDAYALLCALKKYGIHYYDAKPANIMFPDSP